MKIFYYAVLLIAFTFTSNASSVFAQEHSSTEAVHLLKALRSDGVIRVHFTEVVQVPFLKKGLKSKGKLLIHPKGFFVREVIAPSPSVTLISENSITVKDGTGTTTIDKKTAPEVVSAMMLLRALVIADAKALNEKYDVKIQQDKDSKVWSVVLKSRGKNSIFKECTVHGEGNEVKDMVLIESDGVKRKIIFDKVERRATLTVQERELFPKSIKIPTEAKKK